MKNQIAILIALVMLAFVFTPVSAYAFGDSLWSDNGGQDGKPAKGKGKKAKKAKSKGSKKSKAKGSKKSRSRK